MPPLGAAAVSGGALLVVYLATLAPGVTLWDSGEFLAAIRTLGIPHPPGTPLFVFGARGWAALVDGVTLGRVPFTLAVNAASAVSAAATAGLMAWLLTRWTVEDGVHGEGGSRRASMPKGIGARPSGVKEKSRLHAGNGGGGACSPAQSGRRGRDIALRPAKAFAFDAVILAEPS